MSRGASNPSAFEVATRFRGLLWRLPLLVATLVLTAQTAPSWRWWATLSLPLASGILSVYAFRPAPIERWTRNGWLLGSDVALVAMAIYGGASGRPLILAGLALVVLVAVLTSGPIRSLVGTAALLLLHVAASAAGVLPAIGSPWLVVSYAAFVLSAALAFGSLAAHIGEPRTLYDADPDSEQWALLDITETIGSTLDMAQVMRSIVRQVGDLMGVEACSILVADQRRGGCFVIASKDNPEIDMLEVDLHKYPEVRRAMETREPVVIRNVASSPLVESVRDILVEKGYRAMLVVPLVYGRDVLGALFLRTSREDPFSPDEIRFCKLAAGASANALQNALLYRGVAEESERHRATGEKLRRVLDASPDMILATDVEGRITEMNDGAQRLLGWSVERATGTPLADIFGDTIEQAGDPNEEDRGGDGTRFHEIAFTRYDGERFDVSMGSAPLLDASSEPAGRVWIGRDVTQLRRVEHSLAQAERLSSLGEVVAGVAHELNNPLSGVVGYAELLRMHAVDQAQIRDLDRIVDSAMRCQKIVLKLLSFARRHPPEKKSHDLNECVRKVIDLKSYHLRSSKIETRLELDETLPRTHFDFHQIEQVILNLLNNAEQAIGSMRTGGKITLRTGSSNGSVFVRVEDNGPGVPDAIRDRIFDPFFTTKDVGQGTGLGLAVSYGIVNEHGGQIEVGKASPGGGAAFTVRLPVVEVSDSEPEEQTEGRRRSSGMLQGCRVLVAEDEPVVLELMARVLSEDGADVTLARDGEEALAALDAGDYDLIVADLRMPNVDGRQLYERIAEQRPEMLRRFVFATGDLVREDTVAFLENLPNRILTKPLEIETVRRVLCQALETAPRR